MTLTIGQIPVGLEVHLVEGSSFGWVFELPQGETWPVAPTLVFGVGSDTVTWTAVVDGADATWTQTPLEVAAVLALPVGKARWLVGDQVYGTGRVARHG